MRSRSLGKTGLKVSEITLGTVELGMDYGFRGSSHYQRPETQESIRLLHRAVDLGVKLIDTARTYGTSEELIGKALQEISEKPLIASKVTIPPDPGSMDPRQLCRDIFSSIESSLRALQVDSIDLMQVHDLTLQMFPCEEIFDCLDRARQQGKIRFIGACAYGEEVPFKVLRIGHVQTLQAVFNLLDQKLAGRVLPAAASAEVGILTRSAYLRGVLTNQIYDIPERLSPLRDAALGALKVLGDEVQSLAEAALRFCLSFPEVSSVIIGVRSIAELESDIADASKGPFRAEALEKLRRFSIDDETLIDPSYWQDLI